jgi:hypothetical protein
LVAAGAGISFDGGATGVVLSASIKLLPVAGAVDE